MIQQNSYRESDLLFLYYTFYRYPYIAHAVSVQNYIQLQKFNKNPTPLHQYCNCQSIVNLI